LNTKEIILKKLADEKGKFISGESLSDELNISRTAVWKHILKLKEVGYTINAVPRRGYQLEGSLDFYSRCAIVSQLNTKVLGRDLIFLHEIDSTNNELKRLAANGAQEGTVVIAAKQTAGRGRRGRVWSSEENMGIYMSVLLKPDIAPGAVQAITLAASSAVCSTIEPYVDVKPGIKWPNDILLNNRKVCGILTEMTAEPDRIHSIILGIGLNVNHAGEDFKEELGDTAASLRMHLKVNISMSSLAAQFLEEMENLYLDFIKKRCTTRFLNIWRSFSATIGYDIIIYQNEDTWHARALDVLDDGRLLVETQDGRRQAIASAEITIRKADSEG